MGSENINQRFINLFLRFSVVLFLFGVLYRLGIKPDLNSQFWDGFFQIILLLVFVFLAIVIFAVSVKVFNVVAFFLVGISAFFRIMQIIFIEGGFIDIPGYILLIAVSIYFLTKNNHSHHRGMYF
ncbi:MAG: hypothetical protein Q7J34_10765 [Bacteroidales bacterium]|jgi:hypothetical protein|nr:hypothetical protein [Bacteroidales bacterium]